MVSRGEGRATEGSLGSGEPLRSLNPSPRIRIRILLLSVYGKRLIFMTLFKTVAQMPCLRRYFLFRYKYKIEYSSGDTYKKLF